MTATKVKVSRDEEAREWVVRLPFEKYYTLTKVCIVLGRSFGATQRALISGRIQGVTIGGVMHATHQGLIDALQTREDREKARHATPIPIQPVARVKKPPTPKPVEYAPEVQELIDDGTFDFLKDLRPAADGL